MAADTAREYYDDAFLQRIINAPTRHDAITRHLAEDVLDERRRVSELERRAKLATGHLPCAGCGGPHRFDTSIPSVLWNQVVRANGHPDFLCTSCIVQTFALAGISFTAQLWSPHYGLNGMPIEVRIAGAEAQTAALVSEENTNLRAGLNEIRDALMDLMHKGLDSHGLIGGIALRAEQALDDATKP